MRIRNPNMTPPAGNISGGPTRLPRGTMGPGGVNPRTNMPTVKGPMAFKKGGAVKKKSGMISEYGGKEMYSSKKAMMKHEGMEGMKMEKSEGMKGGGRVKKAVGGMAQVRNLPTKTNLPQVRNLPPLKKAAGGMAQVRNLPTKINMPQVKNLPSKGFAGGQGYKTGGAVKKGRGMAIMIAIGKPKGRGKS